MRRRMRPRDARGLQRRRRRRARRSSRQGGATSCTPSGRPPAAKTGAVTTGRPMQENGCANSPRLGRSATSRPPSRSVRVPVERRRAGRRRREQQVDRAERLQRPLQPPAPHPLRPARPGRRQQRPGEEAVAGVGIEIRGPGAQPVEMERRALGVGDQIRRRPARLGGVERHGRDLGPVRREASQRREASAARASSPALSRNQPPRTPTRSPSTPRASAGPAGSAGRAAQPWSCASGPCSAS